MMIMKNFVKNIGKLFYNKLKYRSVYAILSGEMAGATFTYIEEENCGENYAILILSPTEALYISKKETDYELKNDNIMFVDKLPKDHYDLHRAQFIYYAKKKGIYANR